jgi:hypothetical protein
MMASSFDYITRKDRLPILRFGVTYLFSNGECATFRGSVEWRRKSTTPHLEFSFDDGCITYFDSALYNPNWGYVECPYIPLKDKIDLL